MIKELLELNRSLARTEREKFEAQQTEEMFCRAVAWKRLTRACPHDGGWMHIGETHIQCQSCGLVTGVEGWQSLIRWATMPEPNEALGTELVAWCSP